ncbi:amidase [Nocardioides sp. zg-578]|nr:amidase [Nocardioides marmotae]MTB84719.1 amidase [Nocardioides marmotae]
MPPVPAPTSRPSSTTSSTSATFSATFSSTEETARLLDRIATVDPTIRAVCTLAPDALDQARARDVEAAEGRARGPLHGRAVLVKDNIDTADLPTTAGSLALAGQPHPVANAPLVRRLRQAGMVVLGKTNLSEWANIRDAASTSGWSAYGGLTRNPYALDRSAGGSSSGSGAAVAAGLAAYAVGTETDGSISCPAAYNGCVGIKPTVGLVPTAGLVPISRSQDVPGPMATTVRDAAALLSVLAGDGVDYAAHAVDGRLAGRRIGVPRGPSWGYSAEADAAAERALSALSAAGAVVVDGTDLPTLPDSIWDDELLVLLAELRADLATYLSSRPGDGPRDLAELVEFNRRHADVELAHFGQGLFEQALAGPTTDSEEYAAARARCVAASRGGGIDRVLAEHGLDVLVTPAYDRAHRIRLVGPEDLTGSCSGVPAMAGYPLLTVPSGLAGGLPVAVSFWGTAGSERTLVEVAHAYESLRDPLPAPTFAETVG